MRVGNIIKGSAYNAVNRFSNTVFHHRAVKKKIA